MSKLVSIRLDDDVIFKINSMPGRTFSEQFRNLVYFKQDEYNKLIDQYLMYKREYDKLVDDCRELNRRFYALSEVARSASDIVSKFQKYEDEFENK